jgi:hypothetical protein
MSITQGILVNGKPFKEGRVILSASTIRSNFPRMDNSTLAIINIHLDNLPVDKDPIPIINLYLRAYFPSDKTDDPRKLIYLDVPFGIDPEDINSIDAHQKKLDEIVESLMQYAYLYSILTISLILTTISGSELPASWSLSKRTPVLITEIYI